MDLTKEAQSTIPIWVNIYNIPLEYWNPEGLSYIASAIGKPLHVHQMTASCRRISFARMCVEVNAEFELIKDFDIEFEDPSTGEQFLITLKVEYQWSPIRCAKCKKFGHNCANLPRTQKNPKHIPRPSSSSGKKQEEGVWMVISNGKTVVDHDQTCIPSTSSTHENALPLVHSNEGDHSAPIALDQVSSNDSVSEPQAANLEEQSYNLQHNSNVLNVDLHLKSDHDNQGLVEPSVTTITTMSSSILLEHDHGLLGFNKFAILGESGIEDEEVGLLLDQVPLAPQTQLLTSQVNPLTPSSPSGDSHIAKLSKNISCSSGKRS